MAPASENLLTFLVFLVLIGLAIYRFVLWVIAAPRTPNPWDKEVDEALETEEAVPVCHHCFAPQEQTRWFCPECGAIVGPYCNYMPYIYVFSEGEILRAGVNRPMRQGPLIVLGYVLFSLVMFAIAAPIYWFFLFKNLRQTQTSSL